MNKYLPNLLLVVMLSGCSGLWKVDRLESEDFGCWQAGRWQYYGCWVERAGQSFSNIHPVTQPRFELRMDSLMVVFNPDMLGELNILWGPPCIALIPNPFLLALPFFSNHGKFSIVVLFTIDRMDSVGGMPSPQWTMKPSEARFSFSSGRIIEPASFVIGKEDLSGKSSRLWHNQYVLTPDSISEPLCLTKGTRGVRFEFDTETKDVDIFSVQDLGLYKNGEKQIIPQLKLVRITNLLFFWLEGPG